MNFLKKYINNKTGEIILSKNFIKAFIYFKKDSRKIGYKIYIKDIREYNSFSDYI